MALTKASYIDAAMLIAAKGLGREVTNLRIGRAEELANEALRVLAEQIWQSDRRHLLQQEYKLQLTNGARALSGNDDAAPPVSLNSMLQASIEDGIVRLENQTTPFDYQRHYQSLVNDQNNLTDSYTLYNGAIHVVLANGTIGQAQDIIFVTANRIPTADQVPLELEQEAIRLLADLLTGEAKKKTANA